MKRVQLIGLTLGALALAGATSACGNATAGTAQPAPSSSASAEKKDVKVADVLKVPQGNKLVGEYEAGGVQAYTCAAGTWKLLEPAAVLVDGDSKPVMLHSRGPVWVSTVDGSAVEAGAVDGAKVDRPGAIPELLLKAKAVRGDGLLGGVTYVQRLDTEGGVAPTGTCQADALVSVPYNALYAFYESV